MNNILDRLSTKLESLIGIVGLVGILIITANVICRFFKISMSWSDELLRTIFIYGYFIGAALTFYAGDLMRLELLEAYLEKHGKNSMSWLLKTVLSIINLLFFGGLTYFVFSGIIIRYKHFHKQHTCMGNTGRIRHRDIPYSFNST